MKSILLITALVFVGCQGSLSDEDDANNSANNVNNANNANNANNGNNANNANNLNNQNNANNVQDCSTTTCGTNASCVDAACECDLGFVGDPNVECTPGDPCANIECGFGSTCVAGDCACDDGFEPSGDACIQTVPGDTAARTEAEVCTKWNDDHPRLATNLWQNEPATQCEVGVLNDATHTDALRRASLFRWLVGLPAVGENQAARITTQACATTLAAENAGLTHDIPPNYACYTAEGADGAATSNIAQGVNNPADTVDLYVGDRGVPSLGHRRWIFNPSMSSTAFGQRDRYSCMFAFDRTGPTNAEFVAYPAPGPFPAQAIRGVWSISSASLGLSAQTTVEVVNVSDNSIVSTDVYFPGGGFGQPTVGWTVEDAQPGTTYEVRIGNLSGNAGATLTYQTTVVDCT